MAKFVQKNLGFSLAEMMVVLGIMSVVMTGLMQMMTSMTRNQGRANAVAARNQLALRFTQLLNDNKALLLTAGHDCTDTNSTHCQLMACVSNFATTQNPIATPATANSSAYVINIRDSNYTPPSGSDVVACPALGQCPAPLGAAICHPYGKALCPVGWYQGLWTPSMRLKPFDTISDTSPFLSHLTDMSTAFYCDSGCNIQAVNSPLSWKSSSNPPNCPGSSTSLPQLYDGGNQPVSGYDITSGSYYFDTWAVQIVSTTTPASYAWKVTVTYHGTAQNSGVSSLGSLYVTYTISPGPLMAQYGLSAGTISQSFTLATPLNVVSPSTNGETICTNLGGNWNKATGSCQPNFLPTNSTSIPKLGDPCTAGASQYYDNGNDVGLGQIGGAPTSAITSGMYVCSPNSKWDFIPSEVNPCDQSTDATIKTYPVYNTLNTSAGVNGYICNPCGPGGGTVVLPTGVTANATSPPFYGYSCNNCTNGEPLYHVTVGGVTNGSNGNTICNPCGSGNTSHTPVVPTSGHADTTSSPYYGYVCNPCLNGNTNPQFAVGGNNGYGGWVCNPCPAISGGTYSNLYSSCQFGAISTSAPFFGYVCDPGCASNGGTLCAENTTQNSNPAQAFCKHAAVISPTWNGATRAQGYDCPVGTHYQNDNTYYYSTNAVSANGSSRGNGDCCAGSHSAGGTNCNITWSTPFSLQNKTDQPSCNLTDFCSCHGCGASCSTNNYNAPISYVGCTL